MTANSVNAQLEQALTDAKTTAQEQLRAAHQIQVETMVQQLTSGWHSQLTHILDERMGELASRVAAEQSLSVRARARRELTSQLSQTARRLRQFTTEAQWGQAMVDSTEGFCQRAALFTVSKGVLVLRGSRGFVWQALDRIDLASAPAFATAVETKDGVVALRTRSELSEAVATMVGESEDRRCHLFPLVTRERVVAVLYADADDASVDAAALELLTTIGASVIDGLSAGKPQTNLVNLLGVEPSPPKPATWIGLEKEQQEVHLKAQRFARVQVAEMRLYKSAQVKDGRANADLYGQLKTEIDAGREAFRRDFLQATPSMVDYFHMELVRTLANDDADLLGAAYPGPLA